MALDNCLAIETEVEILSIYKGQRLVGDVIAMCEERGYLFCRLGETRKLRPFRMPIGQRGAGVDMVCHALFLKSPDIVARQADASIALVKLIFIALVFEAFDVAFKAIQLLPKDSDRGGAGDIRSFVKQLQDAVTRSKCRHFPIAPISHFEKLNNNEGIQSKFPSLVKLQLARFGLIFSFLRVIRRTERFFRSELSLAMQKSSDIEDCLIRAGFINQANKLKYFRLRDQDLVRDLPP